MFLDEGGEYILRGTAYFFSVFQFVGHGLDAVDIEADDAHDCVRYEVCVCYDGWDDEFQFLNGLSNRMASASASSTPRLVSMLKRTASSPTARKKSVTFTRNRLDIVPKLVPTEPYWITINELHRAKQSKNHNAESVQRITRHASLWTPSHARAVANSLSKEMSTASNEEIFNEFDKGRSNPTNESVFHNFNEYSRPSSAVQQAPPHNHDNISQWQYPPIKNYNDFPTGGRIRNTRKRNHRKRKTIRKRKH